MNIPAFQAAARAAGNTAAATPPPAQPRHQSHQTASPPPSPTLPPEAANRAPQARPVIELSDSALTRRDLPRGSLIDIVA